jgi:hypothetical protein
MISVPVNKVIPDLTQLKRKLHVQSEREEKLLQLVIDEFKLLVDPRYSYKRVKMNEQPLLGLINSSKDLKECLKGVEEGFVVIATLYGAVIPQEAGIALYADRVLSDMTEDLAEFTAKELISKFYTDKDTLTRRYSPGYGDLSLKRQKEIFSLFADAELDVRLTGQFYMQPEKSVSYIVGIKKNEGRSK